MKSDRIHTAVTAISDADRIKRLNKLYELSMTLSGDPVDVFKHVARMIGELFAVRVVCLSEIKGDQLFFISVYVDGQIYQDAGQCSLSITPCATVNEAKDVRLFDRVSERFPEASFLKTHNAYAYCGFPILDNSHNVIAVTCLLDDKPHNFTVEDQDLLRIFGQRISLELERQRHINERLKAEESLRLAASIYESSSEAMMITNKDNHIIAVNPAFKIITGYTEADIIGKTPSVFKSGQHDKAFYQTMWREINSVGKWSGEIWDRRKNGEVYPKWLTINTVLHHDGSVLHYIALFTDITEKKQSEELIWRQANFDTLTGLPNRNMLYDRLDQEIKKARRADLSLALLFLDLDYFKEVNDTLGHAMGDVLLQEAAKRLTSCVREADTVARYAGDEFVILLGTLDDFDVVDRVTQEILQMLVKPFQLGDELAYISTSIGIAFYPNDTTDSDTLIKHADQAMYAAKIAGRNGFSYFTPALQEAAQQRMQLANDLRNALVKNQFWVAYQPIVDLRSGKIIKAEALLRWQHPKKGAISPIDFIPLAEHTGLIIEIGDWVFQQAISQISEWQRDYWPDFQISVNKSPVQIQDKSNKVKPWPEQLAVGGLSGKSIVVEITEGLLLETTSFIKKKLFDFRDAGMEIAVDDFGTGYSSMSYLKKFDIDYIKIDRAFVQNLTDHSDDMVLCEAMIVMAHKLGMKVIAEGVETSEQRDLLVNLGCDYAQGYFFAKPLSAKAFTEFLQNIEI